MTDRSKLKIALIGPVTPYRGGIAQYNTQLHRALQKRCQTQMISFKRQYPSWLYPGKTDLEDGARHANDVNYIIDAYSPLSWRRVADAIIKSGCDLAVLTWWTLFWQPGFAYIARRLKKHGIKTVFLCHNVIDHDASALKRAITTRFIKQADGYIVHATEEAKLLQGLGIRRPILNTKGLPIFDHYPPAKHVLAKRGRLELLFLGFIRPYKGLEVLVEALGQLGDDNIFLTVAGETWEDPAKLTKTLQAKGAPHLELRLEYVNDQTAADLFARADVVVVPYLSATGSGVISLAYHYRKPVVATRVGGLIDAVEDGKTGWLVKPNSPGAIAQVLQNIDRQQAAKMTPAIDAFCKQHSWDNLAKQICELEAEL